MLTLLERNAAAQAEAEAINLLSSSLLQSQFFLRILSITNDCEFFTAECSNIVRRIRILANFGRRQRYMFARHAYPDLLSWNNARSVA